MIFRGECAVCANPTNCREPDGTYICSNHCYDKHKEAK